MFLFAVWAPDIGDEVLVVADFCSKLDLAVRTAKI